MYSTLHPHRTDHCGLYVHCTAYSPLYSVQSTVQCTLYCTNLSSAYPCSTIAVSPCNFSSPRMAATPYWDSRDSRLSQNTDLRCKYKDYKYHRLIKDDIQYPYRTYLFGWGYCVQCTYTVQCTVYIYCTVYSVHILYSVHCTVLCTVQCTLIPL